MSLFLSILLYGSEIRCLREDLFNRRRHFHHRCARTMCRITIAQAIRHRISSASLFKRLTIEPLDTHYNRRLLRWTGHVARMPSTRAPDFFWLVGSTIFELSGAHRWTGAELSKSNFRVMTSQLTLSMCARLRPIEINGVLSTDLKCRVQQPRHWPPHDETSGLSFDAAI
jgi:hypothetical protein